MQERRCSPLLLETDSKCFLANSSIIMSAPLPVDAEGRAYFEKHASRCEDIFSSLIDELMLARADDPLIFFSDALNARRGGRFTASVAAAQSNSSNKKKAGYASGGWSAGGWAASLGVASIVADALGCDETTDLTALRRLGTLSPERLTERLRSARMAERVGELLHGSLMQLASGAAATGEELHARFLQGADGVSMQRDASPWTHTHILARRSSCASSSPCVWTGRGGLHDAIRRRAELLRWP